MIQIDSLEVVLLLPSARSSDGELVEDPLQLSHSQSFFNLNSVSMFKDLGVGESFSPNDTNNYLENLFSKE